MAVFSRSSPQFDWHALDRHGQPGQGRLAARDVEAARSLLRQQGLRVISLTPVAPAQAADGAAPSPRPAGKSGTGISDKQVVLFTRQLATMLQAGLPLLQSLDVAARGAAPPLAKLLHAVRRDVAQGESLHGALGRHPRLFDALLCQLVRAAEEAGMLDTMLARIADDREKALALRGKLRSAMSYPCAVVLVAVAVTAVLLLWVVPSFAQMFGNFGAPLPLATRVVIGLSGWLARYWPWWLGALTAVALGAAPAWRRLPRLRDAVQRASLRLPLLGALLARAALARWSRTLGTLLAAGIPLIDALATAAGCAGHVVHAQGSLAARDGVRNGMTLHAALRGSGAFSELAVQMVAVGEETGALDAMLLRLAAFAEREVDDAVASLTSLLEPFIMAVLGLLIGALVVAMYLPIFSMGSVV